MTPEQIIRRFEALQSERNNVQDVWELINRFVLPFRGDFYRDLNNETELDWRAREIYDSTAVFSAQSLAASMQGNLTSPSTLWFGLKFREETLNDNPAAMEWLEACAQRLFEALQDSNFNIEAAETYLDLVGYGTSILIEEPEDQLEWKGVNFSSIPVRECFFEENHKSQVLNLYRRLQWTPMQMIDKWGDKVPDVVKSRAANPEQANSKMDIIFCIFTREDKKDVDTDKPLAAKNRPYGFKYILKEGKDQIGEEGGYYEMPAFCVRWRKVAGSRWGHSPATVALGDILTLNQLKEAILESAGKVIDPVTLVEDGGLLTDFDLARGGLNVVTDIDRIRAFESAARFDVGAMQVDWLQQSIQKAFYEDQLQLKESPAMTATEVNVRYELMQRLLGPTLGRLQNDFLDPLVQRTFNIMWRAKALPQIPEGVDIGELDIEYTGPLPRAQKSDTAIAIQNWIGNIAALAEVFPQALDRVDIDEAAKDIARLSGVPMKLIRSDQEVKEVRDERAKQQEEARRVAMAEQSGKAAKAAGEGAQALQAGGINLGQPNEGESAAGGARPPRAVA
jgi:hypothetical protein